MITQFLCSLCNKVFPSREECLAHERDYHSVWVVGSYVSSSEEKTPSTLEIQPAPEGNLLFVFTHGHGQRTIRTRFEFLGEPLGGDIEGGYQILLKGGQKAEDFDGVWRTPDRGCDDG